ncbi:ciliary-associated calcium-binding coiled-coil protein 1 isoform X1 [Gadus macrocephalus]|uniref:ciliary-associated calcium-binding coiled-coil protein 1 isoform X1 n=2 Tax=Gadus macrocephalus TaxID=80720 RepID=UPI0028CB60C4|nr:ciliary-associated calcium-binding coiled-coil protein 1 isoform X1 [Gadus macrocephalus]
MSAEVENGEKEEPKEEGTRFLQWEAMSQERISSLLQMTLDEVLGELEVAVGLGQRQSCMREVALLDYYSSGFWWAKESGFSPAQISFSMAVFQRLLDNIKEDKGVGFVENWMDLANALNGALQQGAGVPLLSAEQATALVEHVTNSLFQHYRLYELLFTIPREQALIGIERTIEVICQDAIAPLEEGMSADQDVDLPLSQEQEEANQEESGGEQQADNSEGRPRELVVDEEEDVGQWSIQEVEEVMSELAKEMMGSLQADFSEKLRIHERSFSAKIGHLKDSASK